MKRRSFLKGLGIVTGGAALIPNDFLYANETKTPNEPKYDIKVVTNIKNSDDSYCLIHKSTYDLNIGDTQTIKCKLNKEGIAYVTLPEDMKFGFIDIAAFSLKHSYTRVDDVYMTTAPQEIILMASDEMNYI
jgi:hypothetical protein